MDDEKKLKQQALNLRIVMLPWLSFGHFIPYLHLANRLAELGNISTTLLLPPKSLSQLQKLNLHPSLITLHPITLPHVQPLPPSPSVETTSDIPFHLQTHLATSLDRFRPQFESIITSLRPNLLFYDLAHWVPQVGSSLCIPSVSYMVVSSPTTAYGVIPARLLTPDPIRPLTEDDVAKVLPPPGYPSTTVVIDPKFMLQYWSPFGEGLTFLDRVSAALTGGHAIAFRAIREFEGKFCDYISTHFNKPVLVTGPALPEPKMNEEEEKLEPKWAEWLGRFQPGSVVFCSFGSQFVFEDEAQFREVVHGFEMTKLPFLLALRPPTGCGTIKEALPEGFEDRVGDRGLVYGGWVPQVGIVGHPSVGCFVSHCGPGTLWEALMTDKQLVFIPQFRDQMLSCKVMTKELKLGVEVERREGGWVSKERLCEAIKCVMDEGSEIGGVVKKNHGFWREKLLSPGLMSDYIHKFIQDLQQLVASCP